MLRRASHTRRARTAEFRAAARNKFQSIFDGNRVFGENTSREAECATKGSARSEVHPLKRQFFLPFTICASSLDKSKLFVDLRKCAGCKAGGPLRAGAVDALQIGFVLPEPNGFLPDGAEQLHHRLRNGGL